MEYPEPKTKTLCRIHGPCRYNGMDVWRVFDVRLLKQLGGDCFSYHEAKKRADDFISGRRTFYFGNNSFIRKNIH